MAFTVTHNFITIYDMESLTGWTGPASLTLNTDINRQGTACIGWLADTVDSVVWGPAFTARDLSSTGGTRIVWAWVNVLDYLDLEWGYSNGIIMCMEDSLGNQAYWQVGGRPNTPNDNRRYSGGWKQVGVATNVAPNGYFVGTSIDLTQVVRIGFSVRKQSVSTSLSQDVFIDWCYLDSEPDTGVLGPIIYGPNNTDGNALQEAADVLEAADIGILRRYGNGYILTSRLNIGVADGVNTTRFVSTGKSLAGRTEGAMWAIPSIVCNGALGSETVFILGQTIGTPPDDKGLNGGYLIGPGTPMVFNLGNQYVSGGLYGVTFLQLYGWGGSNLNNANFEYLNCVLNINGSFLNSQFPRIESCTIFNGDNSTAGSIRFGLTSDINIKNCDFINNQGALGIGEAGTYTFDGLRFYNNVYDIVNYSGGDVIVQCINGSNPDPLKVNNVNGGSVTIITLVTVSITCYDAESTSTPIQGASVLLKAASGGPLPYKNPVTITNDGAGTATVTETNHPYSTGDYAVIEGANEPEYNKLAQVTVVDASTYTYSIATIPAGSATGSPTSTKVILYGTTDANGNISISVNYTGDQPVEGWVRRGTNPTYYKQTTLGGTITANGFIVNAFMVPDE